MNLHLAIKDFLDRPELRPATRRSYSYDLYAMRDYLGPARELDDIIPADILRYAIHMNKKEGIKSDHTYNKHVTSIRAFFNFCEKMRWLDEVPTKALAFKKVSHQRDDVKAMPDKHLSSLLQYVAETPRGWNPREEALVRFLADTGCRIGGARTLTWDRVELSNQKAHTYEKGKLEPHTKIFGRECAHALTAWRLKQDNDGGKYVFSSKGALMSDGGLAQYFRRLCIRANIHSPTANGWGPHSLRHRFGVKAIKKFDVKLVAMMLGDTVEVVIQHYLRRDEQSVEHAMRQMTTDFLLTDARSDTLLSFIHEEEQTGT